MKHFSFLFFFSIIITFTSCIQDAALNPECDILTFSFPTDALLVDTAEISNEYVVVYPKKGVSLEDSVYTLTVTSGATYERIDKVPSNDTLFFIKVTSQDKNNSKTYPITQVRKFTSTFTFENWIKVHSIYKYENPKDDDIQWYSSNNGTALVLSNKAAQEYPVRKTTDCVSGTYAAELVTQVGPGSIAGGVNFIPCLSGSLYLGSFNALDGLKSPLHATQFGIPFTEGRPLALKGYYKYKEGTQDFINSDGSTDPNKHDICTIYAVLFKTTDNVKYLYGDNVTTSENIIAIAQIESGAPTIGDDFIPFDLKFNYDSYHVKFNPDEMDKYKITIVFASSKRGAYYEGRPGSRLVVDQVELQYEEIQLKP